MARFSGFTSHISLLLVDLLILFLRISSNSSSSPSSSLALSPDNPDVKNVSIEYHPPSLGSPSLAETEYDSLSPPVYPSLGHSRSFKSPLPETGRYAEAMISPTTTSESPEQPPFTSPLPSTPVEAPNLPAPSASPLSLSLSYENVESSPVIRPEDEEGSEASLWPDQQVTSSMPYVSSLSNRGDDDFLMYEQKPEKQPGENEASVKGEAGKGGIGFGVGMGVCMVGLGGLAYMKRRKENDVRRTRRYMQLAERKSLMLGFPSIQRV